MADLESTVRRARNRTLIMMVVVFFFASLAVWNESRLDFANARLRQANADLQDLSDQLASVSSDLAEALADRGVRRGDLDDAENTFLRAEAGRIEGNPLGPEDHYLLGVMAFLNRDYDTAEEALTQALDIRGEWADAYLARGRNSTAQRNYESAIEDLSRGLDLDPQNSDLHAARCLALMKSQQLAEALQDCNAGVENATVGIWVPLNYRGFVNYLLRQDEQAQNDWRRAAEFRSEPASKSESLENVALIYLRSGDWTEASRLSEEIAKVAPDSPWNCLFRGIAEHKLGREEAAQEAFACWRRFRTPDDDQDLSDFLPTNLHSFIDNGEEPSIQPC